VVNVKLKTQDKGLKVWEKVRIIAGEGSAAGVFEARVEDIVDEGIVVTHPQLVSGSVLLREDLAVRVQITREDAAYQFTSVIRSHGDKSIGRRAILTPPMNFRRVQRRQFSRIDIVSKVDYTRFRATADWNDWRNGHTWHRTRSFNISAGGILLKVTRKVATNSLLILKVDLMRQVGLPEMILAVCCRECTRNASLCCGVRFLLASELHRYIDQKVLRKMPRELKEFDTHFQDRLVMHLFHKQIELRQKGLL